MEVNLRRSKIQIIVIICVLIPVFYFYGNSLGMLIFCILWQFFVASSILESFKVDKIVNAGHVVMGNIIKVISNDPEINEEMIYDVQVEFNWPDSDNTYVTKGRLLGLTEDKKCKIYVNVSNPTKSVIAETLNKNRKITRVILSLVFILLFYVDYILLGNVLN